jgi:cytochrome P450
MAGTLVPAVEDEARAMLARNRGRMGWWEFVEGWDAMVRRLLFGQAARDDHELMDLLRKLRRRANFVLAPRDEAGRQALHERMAAYLARGEAGSLAERMAGLRRDDVAAPTHQIAQYLFALNTSGMAVWRALALLVAHPEVMAEAREEAQGDRRMLPLLRASVYESVRIWPTTPAILREAVRDVDWDGAVIPKGTSLVVYAPFFHRDPGLSFADRFAPELWLDEARGVRVAAEGPMALVPFSAGPGLCPAADLLPMIGSAWLAEVISHRDPQFARPGRLRADRRLPGELDPFSVSFRFR